MAQWSLTRRANLPYDDTLYEQYVKADRYGNIESEGAAARSAFGEMLSVPVTPIIQLDPIYGLQDDQYQTFTGGGGTATTTTDSLFQVSSTSTLGSYGVIRSRRFLRYRAGQGAMCRITAAFNGNSGSSLRAGLFNQETALQVGVHNGRFGILHSYGGKAEIRILEITAASTGGTATITVNGTGHNVALVNGETAIQTAARIARTLSITGWIIEHKSQYVVFLSESTGSIDGTFSYSSTGTSTGTFTRTQTGVTRTDDWIYQEDFNLDKLNGRGPSGMLIDVTKLNVFQINFRWLGAGESRFAIEDPSTGDMFFFHHIHWSNSNTVPWTHNPNFKIGYVAFNIGGAEAATVTGASMMGANEGVIAKNDYGRSATVQKSSLASGTIHHLLSLRNPITENSKINTREIILADVSVAHQGNDPLELFIFLNADLDTGTQIYYQRPESVTVVSTETGTLLLTSHTPVASFVTGINGQQQFDLEPYRITVPAGDTISIGCRSGQSIAQVAVASTWLID